MHNSIKVKMEPWVKWNEKCSWLTNVIVNICSGHPKVPQVSIPRMKWKQQGITVMPQSDSKDYEYEKGLVSYCLRVCLWETLPKRIQVHLTYQGSAPRRNWEWEAVERSSSGQAREQSGAKSQLQPGPAGELWSVSNWVWAVSRQGNWSFIALALVSQQLRTSPARWSTSSSLGLRTKWSQSLKDSPQRQSSKESQTQAVRSKDSLKVA